MQLEELKPVVQPPFVLLAHKNTGVHSRHTPMQQQEIFPEVARPSGINELSVKLHCGHGQLGGITNEFSTDGKWPGTYGLHAQAFCSSKRYSPYGVSMCL